MKFTEQEMVAIGGLSESDRMVRGIGELVDLALATTPRFKETMASGKGIRDWWRAAQTGVSRLREANSETALGFLLRKGVQAEANDWYRVTEAHWQDYCRVAGSNGYAEWYAPLYPGVVADRVQRGTPFPEGRIIGEDSHLVNQKFGLIESLERELFDDDQTGQIRDRSARLGQSMRTTETIYAAYRFLGSERTYANLTVPASNYTTKDPSGNTITGPWSTTLFASAAGNRLSTYHVLNMGFLKQAWVSLMNATDPLSNKLIVTPNVLLTSSMDVINAKLLLADGYYPAVPGQSNTAVANAPVLGASTSAAGANQGVLAGFPGGAFSQNPIAGLGLTLVTEKYLPDWAWAIGEKGRGFVFQERDPLEIVQEQQQSGSAFILDVYRFRSRRRFEVDWIAGGSRFWFLGNDGTATGVQ